MLLFDPEYARSQPANLRYQDRDVSTRKNSDFIFTPETKPKRAKNQNQDEPVCSDRSQGDLSCTRKSGTDLQNLVTADKFFEDSLNTQTAKSVETNEKVKILSKQIFKFGEEVEGFEKDIVQPLNPFD